MDKEFALWLGRHIGGNVVWVLTWVGWWLEQVIEVLDMEHFWHNDA